MAETVMKFGPEWLRALSDGGPNVQNNIHSTPTKYKLAEYRYGREEMLALFTEKTTIPEELKESKDIVSEKCQIPLALIPMSEEEHRLWSRCVNSDAVMRITGKTSSSVSERVPSDRGALRGKASGIDRGRGRGRNYYQRGSSYEDDLENGSERRDFRPKTFDRTSNEETHREKGFDRPLVRNDSLEDNSRRKDPRNADNWRSSNRNDDRSWRSRGRGDDGRVRGNSWRNDDHDENDYRNGFNNKKYSNQHRDRGSSEQWDDCDDEDRRCSLPEWSLDDGPISEAKVGTFDASGAFREGSIDGDSKESDEKKWLQSVKSGDEADDQESSDNEKPPESIEKTLKGTPCPTKSNEADQQYREEQQRITESVPASTEPSVSTKPSTDSFNSEHSQTPMKNALEEDGFAHLEKAAESMVAQWTAEEDQKERQCKDSGSKMMVVPLHHEDAYKWFYRDPQGELQGPFTPQEMLEWFTAGYFTMDLLVRRGCDEVFSQLGELINTWNRVPFVPGQNPPPIRSVSSSSPSLLSALQSSPTNNLRQQLMQQQQHQQQIQRQMYLNQQLQMQTQLRQLFAQLKQREGFSDLTPQEQQEVLVQHYISTQQLQRQLHPNIPQEQPTVSNPMVQFVPLVAGNSAPLIAQTVSSIWELNGGVMTSSTLEEMQRQEQERREAEEKQRKLIEEQRRRNEEDEHRRRLEELQRKLEEERKRKEELLRKQEEERRKKEEEERIRIEEERRKMEEEKRRLEEQQRRQEEIKRLEELSRKQREEELEKRRREAEEAERIKHLQELERQRKFEAEVLRQEQEEVFKRLQEQKKAWGTQSHSQSSVAQNTVSLAEIQRLQEQKDREERMKQAQLQQNMQALFQVQQAQQQKQLPSRQQLTWANANCQQVPVKTLTEIQREEAERMAKQKQLDDQKHLQQGSVSCAGIWSNAASQLTWKANSNAWESVSSAPKSNSVGFWESDPPFAALRKPKLSESALPSSNKSSCSKTNCNSRSRKDEEVVLKLFENQRRQQNDEFTQWCIDALEKFQSFIDIPTFVAFLKDVDPPYEVSDYVKSYLGESKETREFAKQFVEKRSFYRNQAKKDASEELMWGPAPAITPSLNKSVSVSSAVNAAGGEESTSLVKSGKKKKKGKKVDNSILGFTVQADPDRVNVGEIEQIND